MSATATVSVKYRVQGKPDICLFNLRRVHTARLFSLGELWVLPGFEA